MATIKIEQNKTEKTKYWRKCGMIGILIHYFWEWKSTQFFEKPSADYTKAKIMHTAWHINFHL